MIFKNFFLFFKSKIHSLYLNSNIYDNKISAYNDSSLEYRQKPNQLEWLIKYEKKN